MERERKRKKRKETVVEGVGSVLFFFVVTI